MAVKNIIKVQAIAPNHIVAYYYKLKNNQIPNGKRLQLLPGLTKN
ncbi:transposase (fragment) [Latilactobacillus sakei]